MTSYQVPDNYLGDAGRKVRCASCGDTWLAKAQEEPVSNLEEKLDTSGADVEDMVSGGEEQSQDDIDALFDSPSGGEEQSQDDIDALFDSPSGGEEQSQDDIDALFDSPSGGEEQSQDDIDALFDSPSGGGEDQSQDDIDALFDSPSGGGEQSQDDIDSLFDAEPSASTKDLAVSQSAGQGGDAGPVVDMVDAQAFEMQKAVAKGHIGAGGDIETNARRKTRRANRKKGKQAKQSVNRDRLYWLSGGGALAASLLLVVGFLAAPATFVRVSPDLAGLYSLMGMEVNLSGVFMRNVSARLRQQSGAPVISVKADLVNARGEPVLLPKVELSVLGKEGAELYSWSLEPEGVGLGPGESRKISSQIAAPVQAKQILLRVAPSQ
jgi:predicted Zn finger-like uncharacterized protein